VDEQFPRSVRLFHYTSAEGLFGILQSGSLWASHRNFLNDTSEFQHLLKLLPAFFEVSSLPANWLRNQFSSALKLFGVFESFVLSMYVAEKGTQEFRDGLLDHWKNYGKNGYAIQFCQRKLSKVFQNEAKRGTTPSGFVISSPVFYLPISRKKLNERHAADLDRLMSMGPALVRNSKKLGLALSKDNDAIMGLSLLLASGFVKNEHFANEREARIVYALPFTEGHRQRPVFFRQQGSLTIPYIKLLEGDLLGKESPIERIVIGPGVQKENEIALRLLLKTKGLSSIELRRSSIPFRSG
jgi:hypothetical protein